MADHRGRATAFGALVALNLVTLPAGILLGGVLGTVLALAVLATSIATAGRILTMDARQWEELRGSGH